MVATKKLPRVSPLVLTRRRDAFDHPDWLFELKHDGFRGLAYISNARCELVSRNGNIFRRFKPLCDVLGKLKVQDAILDGEIVCLDKSGASVFRELMFRRGALHFYAFDLLWINGRDLRSLPLVNRKAELKRLLARAKNPTLLYAHHIERYGEEFFRTVCARDLEGIVAKPRSSIYETSAHWVKIKNPAYSQAEGRHELFERNGHAKTNKR